MRPKHCEVGRLLQSDSAQVASFSFVCIYIPMCVLFSQENSRLLVASLHGSMGMIHLPKLGWAQAHVGCPCAFLHGKQHNVFMRVMRWRLIMRMCFCLPPLRFFFCVCFWGQNVRPHHFCRGLKVYRVWEMRVTLSSTLPHQACGSVSLFLHICVLECLC